MIQNEFSRCDYAPWYSYSSTPLLYTSLPESGRVSRVVVLHCVESSVAGWRSARAVEQQRSANWRKSSRGERASEAPKMCFLQGYRSPPTCSSRSRIHRRLPVSGAICRRTSYLCASCQVSGGDETPRRSASLLCSREPATEKHRRTRKK